MKTTKPIGKPLPECSRCGLCCLGVVIKFDTGSPDRDLILFSQLHGMEVDLERGWIWIPCRCRDLSPDGLCKRYAARPERCVQYPQRGDWVPGCCTCPPPVGPP
jgi:uncharacterized cysteine cluster protein YcgN (CxxCxxCC family)